MVVQQKKFQDLQSLQASSSAEHECWHQISLHFNKLNIGLNFFI